MGKKPKKIRLWTNRKKKELGIYELRWECMRRSKEYQDDYKNYRRTCDEIYSKTKDADAVNEYEKEQICFFAEKYRIGFPLDPSISTWFPEKFSPQQGSLVACLWNKDKPKLINETLSYLVKGAICLDSDRHIIGAPYGEVPDYEPLSDEELRKKDNIKIVVDLDAPLPTIIEEASRIVSHWKKLRSRVLPKRKPYRLRLNQYKQYLEVYDLKKTGWSWEKLAKKFYKKQGGELNYKKQKVIRDYNRAEALIEKGTYRQIR